MRGYPC